MIASSHFVRLLPMAVLGCVVGFMPCQGASLLDGLVTNNPFGQTKPGQTAETGTQTLEFRGIMEDNGQQRFIIYDTTAKKSRWVALNTPGEDFVLKGYDAAGNTVTLDQHGRLLTLALKSGPKIAQNLQQPMPPHMPQTFNQAGLPGQSGGPPVLASKGPEAQRLQQIAEEIRRRRAMRAQSPPLPNPVPLQPGTNPPMTTQVPPPLPPQFSNSMPNQVQPLLPGMTNPIPSPTVQPQ